MLLNLRGDLHPQLNTPRLLLRKLTLFDVDDLFAVNSDPQVSRYVLWDTHKTTADTRSLIRYMLRQYRDGEPASLAMVHKETGKVIGTIGFTGFCRESNSAEVGYSIGRRHWGQGLTTEALCALLRHGMETMHLNRIEAVFDVRNAASGRVMQKAGMQKEGVLRQRLYNKGEYIDVEMWAILSRDWQANI